MCVPCASSRFTAAPMSTDLTRHAHVERDDAREQEEPNTVRGAGDGRTLSAICNFATDLPYGIPAFSPGADLGPPLARSGGADDFSMELADAWLLAGYSGGGADAVQDAGVHPPRHRHGGA